MQQEGISSSIQEFLDRFYLSRIGIRILIRQHIALGGGERRPDYVGIICTRTNIASVGTDGLAPTLVRVDALRKACRGRSVNVRWVPRHDAVGHAIEDARFICRDHYGMYEAPPVLLHCDANLHFPYIPAHLHHVLVELLKNSLRGPFAGACVVESLAGRAP